MSFKKIFSGLSASVLLFASVPAFANGVPAEDKETICKAMEKITEKRQSGYCQFIYESPVGKSLLAESIKYALDLGKYKLAEKFIDIFANFYDLNDIEDLDYLVVKTGKKDLYESLIKKGYKTLTADTCTEWNNLLHAAIESENLEFVEKFLNEGFDPNNASIYRFERYPLHICLAKIASIADSNNGHGIEQADSKAEIEHLSKIIKLLCEKGADPFLCSGKMEDKSAFDLLEELNPENEKNCYDKLEFYDKDSVEFCEKLYQTLRSYIYSKDDIQESESAQVESTQNK